MAFSGLVYRKRGRDASASFYVAPTGLDCSLLHLPRAMPWATIDRPFGAERNSLYSNSEIGLGLSLANATFTGHRTGRFDIVSLTAPFGSPHLRPQVLLADRPN